MDLGAGPVACVGGRTQWTVGGPLDRDVREVRAPAGIVEYEPAEMVVRVRAGTLVAELDAALAEHGQMTPLDPSPSSADRATVGGVLAVGHSGLRRLRYGPVRDVLLEATIALADGSVVKAGGPVVKNVTGFDLCRLFVGSLGTLGFLVEAVLRCQPRPRLAVWLRSDGADPFDARSRLFRPSSILWDGRSTWVLLEGYAADVEAESRAIGAGWTEVAGPPPVPTEGRTSVRPSALRDLDVVGVDGHRVDDGFVAEVGVGVVHRPYEVEPPPPHPSTIALQQRVKAAFDPDGRMNPGRRPW